MSNFFSVYKFNTDNLNTVPDHSIYHDLQLYIYLFILYFMSSPTMGAGNMSVSLANVLPLLSTVSCTSRCSVRIS